MIQSPFVQRAPIIAIIVAFGLTVAPALAQVRSPYNQFPRSYSQGSELATSLDGDDRLLPSPTPLPPPENPFSPPDGECGAATDNGTAALPGIIGDLFALQLGARPFRAAPVSGGLKLTENEGMRPQDRVYVAFNYFNDVNRRVNQILQGSVTRMDFYRETFGIEKTLFGGRASVGFRLPLCEFHADSPFAGMGGTDTILGDMAIVLKGTLLDNPIKGNYVSAGMMIGIPSGRAQWGAGTAYFNDPHDTVFQGFVGWILRRGQIYFQGCNSMAIPTSSSHASELNFDGSFGWIVYQGPCDCRWIAAVIPILEYHTLVPIDNIGVRHNPLGEFTVVDFTEGITTQLRRRTYVTVGVSEPVTGPKPFTIEGILQLNVRF
jgi:hypothetical protein